METPLTSSYTTPIKRQRLYRVAEVMSTGGFSLLSESGYPSQEELHDIEEKRIRTKKRSRLP